MYTEEDKKVEKKGMDIKDFLIKAILVILFVLLLLWLLPLGKDNNNNDPLLNNIFSENIIKMKESAINYYTLERLPVNTGEKKILTLKEMQELKLMTPFVDKNGKTCDVYNSYVEITKNDKEYVLKVNLKCSDKEDYIIVHLGCYDYCKTYICEVNKPVVPPTPEKPIIPDKPAPGVSYIYEYSKWFAAEYSNWSDWSADIPYKLGQIDFGTTELEIKEDLGKKRVLVGYNVSYDKNKPLFKNSYVKVGTVKERVCAEYEYYVNGNTVYEDTAWIDAGIVKSQTALVDTNNVKYVYLYPDYEGCAACTSTPVMVYQKYTRVLKSVGTSGSVTVTCKDYETKTLDVYGIKATFYAYQETRVPLYGDVYYYRKRNRNKTKEGYTDVKWSNYGDNSLLNNGYKYTGNKKAK